MKTSWLIGEHFKKVPWAVTNAIRGWWSLEDSSYGGQGFASSKRFGQWTKAFDIVRKSDRFVAQARCAAAAAASEWAHW